jgi:hypothetical protein
VVVSGPRRTGLGRAASDRYCRSRGTCEFQQRVRGVLAQEPRQRDSVKMTISHALTGWLVSGLDSTPTDDLRCHAEEPL